MHVGLGNCTVVNSPLNYLSWDPLNNERLIYNRTLDMTADLAMGKYYDTKAFYALMQARATYDSLVKQKAKRPFVLTRSGFVGSGRYAAHWTGDNTEEWTCKAGGICDSVQQVIASNLWGINVVGADIGGFSEGTLKEELMVRWTQLGAFYTFMRNHHGMDHDQEWYIYSDTAVGAFKQAMKDRYQLLPTIFSELVKSYFLGGPVLRHPSVQCPTELPTYRETTSFFVGPSILVLPVVEAGASSVTSYLPTGMWYDLWNGSVVSTSGGVFATLPAKLYERMPTLLRGGSALSLHTAAAMTISQTRASGISILCAMNGDTGASGETWFDDGQDSLLTSQESVRRTSIQCYGGPSSGGVRVTVAGTGPTPHALPLAAPAFVRVYFAQDITSYSGKLDIRVDGIGKVTSYRVSANKLEVDLPLAVDGSQPLSLAWATSSPPAVSAYTVRTFTQTAFGYSGRMTYDGTAPKGTFHDSQRRSYVRGRQHAAHARSSRRPVRWPRCAVRRSRRGDAWQQHQG